MKALILNMSGFVYSFIFFSLLIISSCCFLQSGTSRLVISDKDFPSTASVNEEFDLDFTIRNETDYSFECDEFKSSSGSVNLKLINRETGYTQVDNSKTLNPLDQNTSQSFYFTVIIGTESAGTYDMTFFVNSSNIAENTVTGVIVVK